MKLKSEEVLQRSNVKHFYVIKKKPRGPPIVHGLKLDHFVEIFKN